MCAGWMGGDTTIGEEKKRGKEREKNERALGVQMRGGWWRWMEWIDGVD